MFSSIKRVWNRSSIAVDVDRTCALNKATRRWLVVCLVANVLALGMDRIAIVDRFHDALILRLVIVTPLMVAALGAQLWPASARLRLTLASIATIAFVATIAALGQLAVEPFASRYLMVAQFTLFAAMLLAGLPWRYCKVVYCASLAAYTAINLTGLRWQIVYDNLDLVVFCAIVCGHVLYMRRLQERQNTEIAVMREIDARRTLELEEANKKLALLSTVDPLTGVFNRRYLETLVSRRDSLAKPERPFGVLMIDVDYFKLLNDTCGHAEGDRCLRTIATAIRDTVRNGRDIVVRYGGEEFTVILPGASLKDACAAAERILASIGRLRIPHPGLGAHGTVTVSIGACSTQTDTLIDGLRKADAALYRAKSDGRNRVVLDSTESPRAAIVA